MSDLRTSPALPGYKILEELGRDRLGVIYRAHQSLYHREVALRLIDDHVHEGLRDLTDVCRAADDAGRHHHDQLLTLHESGENEGQFYLVADLPPGRTLRQKLAAGPMTPDTAAKVIASVARAVAHLHSHHALHLGLTSAVVYPEPDNTATVGDIGLAGLLHNRPGRAYPGEREYAAPEQLAGRKADARADVYALGCLLVECLTGKPLSGDRLALPNCPRPLAHIVKKATASSPMLRYADASALADDLERFTRGEAPEPDVLHRVVANVAKLPAWPLVAGLLLALVGVAGLWWSKAGEVKRLQTQSEEQRQLAEDNLNKSRALIADRDDAGQKTGLELRDTRQKLQSATSTIERETKRALEEQRLRRDAEKRIADESKARALAEERTRLADSAREVAETARLGAGRDLARVYVGHGNAVLGTSDLTGALVPFVRALAIASRDKMPEDAHRLRIAATLARCPRPINVLRAARGDIAFLKLSPTGKHVLVVGADGVVTVRDTTGGDVVGKQITHGSPVVLATFSPDGSRVLTADRTGRVRLWKVADGELAFEALELASVPIHIGFSGDGKRFLTIRPNMGEEVTAEAQVRDAASAESIGELISAGIALKPGALSHDGSRVVLCAPDRAARVHDVSTGKPVGTSLEHVADLDSASYSPDGRSILTLGDGIVRVWNTATGKQRLDRLEHTATAPPAFDDGGRLLLTVADSEARIHDVIAGKPYGVPLKSKYGLREVALAPDGRSVLLASADGTVRIVDVMSGQEALPPLLHGTVLSYAGLTPDGARAVTFDGRIIRVWDVTAGDALAPPGPPDEPGAFYSHDGKRLARVKGDTVQLHDLQTGAAIGAAMKHKGVVKRVVFNRAGDLLLTVADPPEKATTPSWDARLWDAATGKPIGEAMEHLREVSYADFAGSNRVLTLCLDKNLRLFDTRTGQLAIQPIDHREDLTLGALSPDGKLVISCDSAGVTRAWDAESGLAHGEPMTYTKPVRALAFSGDGKLLAACAEDGVVIIWRLEKNEKVQTLEHAAGVSQAVFTADGKSLLTGCIDGVARVWMVETGKPLTPPMMHDDAISVIELSEDGRWLLVGAGRFVRLWDMQTGEPIGPPLPHTQTGTISYIRYTKKGELTIQSGPGTRYTRVLAAETKSPAELSDFAVFLSAREESLPGQFMPVSMNTFGNAWERMFQRHSDEFRVPKSRVQAWARRGAAECEARGLWGGVSQHLDVLLEGSDDVSLHARRGRARAELGRNELALADYDKALVKEQRRADWWAGRAGIHAAMGKWDLAAADLEAAVKLDERDASLWRRLGHAEGERGRWKEAADALSKAVRFGGNDATVWAEHALALALASDAAGYQQLCARMVKKFTGRDETSRRALAETCALMTGGLADYKELLKLLESTTQETPQEQSRYAAVLLRAGEAAKAVMMLEKLSASAQPAESWLLALAYQKAGQQEKAKEAQAKAADSKARPEATWAERHTAALWRREAEGK